MSVITLDLSLNKIQKLIEEWDENYHQEFNQCYKSKFEDEVDELVKDLLSKKYLEKIKSKTGVSIKCAEKAMETVEMFITEEDKGNKYPVKSNGKSYTAEVINADKIIIWDGDSELKLNNCTKRRYYDIAEKLELILIKSFRHK